MGTAYSLLGHGVGNLVIFLLFPTLFGDIHVAFLFLFSRVLLWNRDPFQLPHWWYYRLAGAEHTWSRRPDGDIAYSRPRCIGSDCRLYDHQHFIIRHQFWQYMNEINVIDRLSARECHSSVLILIQWPSNDREFILFGWNTDEYRTEADCSLSAPSVCLHLYGDSWFMIQGAPTHV